jgi:tetratricopeptide (TPR) repeat protein
MCVSVLEGLFKVHAFKFLYALALVTIIAASLSACAQSQAEKTADIYADVPARQTFSGSYLAGRFAQRQQDWESAQDYMGAVLSYDKDNDQIIQRTFLLALGSGNFARAKELAQKVVLSKNDEELALIFMSCDAISRDDFAAALGFLKKLPSEGFGQYTKPLLTAWSLAGQGKKAEALKILSDSATEDDPTYRMHAGMMEEMAGNMNAASAHYKVAMANGLNLHTAVLVGNFYERYGRPEITRTIYQGLDKIYPFNPFISSLSHRDPHRVIKPNVMRAADGAALALFDLATLLYEKRAYDSAQIYSSLVRILTPASPFVKLMMGDIAALHSQYDKAIAEYNAIDTASPIYWLSRIRVTEVYEAGNQIDQAVAMLKELSKDETVRTQALVSLGDIYRRHDRFENAIEAYNQALAGIPKITEEHWPIIYARGMAEERLNNWKLAEKDLLQALAFQPDNPMILNFIAYSWANQGVNLQKALEYAKTAALLRPDDGYILDSYGWTLFRLTQYQESINWLEQAVAQIPDDSTLLDHLGDAYWQVGRLNEARYQWRHAHDLSQDPAFKKLVDQKLEHGITIPSMVARSDGEL